ncbi:hypothetical protein KIPB_002961 [Kipferlia bialata]|uniref:Uncharacterized protein n=1 Tax=Kipferlia bialata TaxID=797122 RepID=A0A9K3CRG6_9EUKA|nr:hypothetical protein KIPB_002961 [Kipferlia bialata]|eukprot:g2961.t1
MYTLWSYMVAATRAAGTADEAERERERERLAELEQREKERVERETLPVLGDVASAVRDTMAVTDCVTQVCDQAVWQHEKVRMGSVVQGEGDRLRDDMNRVYQDAIPDAVKQAQDQIRELEGQTSEEAEDRRHSEVARATRDSLVTPFTRDIGILCDRFVELISVADCVLEVIDSSQDMRGLVNMISGLGSVATPLFSPPTPLFSLSSYTLIAGLGSVANAKLETAKQERERERIRRRKEERGGKEREEAEAEERERDMQRERGRPDASVHVETLLAEAEREELDAEGEREGDYYDDRREDLSVNDLQAKHRTPESVRGRERRTPVSVGKGKRSTSVSGSVLKSSRRVPGSVAKLRSLNRMYSAASASASHSAMRRREALQIDNEPDTETGSLSAGASCQSMLASAAARAALATRCPDSWWMSLLEDAAELDLSNIPVTDADMAPLLAGCANLEALSLAQTSVTDVGVLDAISGCPGLTTVDIRGCQVDAALLTDVRAELPSVDILLSR